MNHGNRRKNIDFFKNNKQATKILQDVELSSDHLNMLDEFFTYYLDRDRAGIWRKNIAIWITHGLDDWVNRRSALSNVTSNSIEWHRLMYGTTWKSYFDVQAVRLRKLLPNTAEYWTAKGITDPVYIVAKIKEIQTERGNKAALKLRGTNEYTTRSAIYWTKHGYSKAESEEIVANLQRRDKDYFVGKYGQVNGEERFLNSKSKRKTTWESKDKAVHAIKTRPKQFNEHGQEMQAIRGFLRENRILSTHCRYGPPNEQFYQQIPNIGVRRYDLAVFTDATRTILKYIMEFHGPGHIKFSEYREELQDKRITLHGKELMHLGTYGAAYYNDKAKRDWILSKNKGVKYIVMWVDDLKNKRFNIDELL